MNFSPGKLGDCFEHSGIQGMFLAQLLRPIVYVEVNSSILTALRSKFPEFIKLFKPCISD